MVESMNKVQIIMATYCGSAYIREQMDSLLALHYQNWNLLICDDGSTDATLEILEEYQKRMPDKIQVHKNTANLGATKNFLSGLMLAVQKEADYFMFCDQDDVWFADRIQVMLKRMKQMERAYGEFCPLLVVTDAIVTDAKLSIREVSYHRAQQLDIKKRDLAHMLMENKYSGCMMMLNRALAEKISVIPQYARYHDWWVALAAAAFGHIGYCSCPTLFYRQHSGNLVGSQTKAGYLKNAAKHWREQKKSLLLNQRQAGEFLKLYSKELTPARRKLVREFAALHRRTFLDKRIMILRFGFLKSSLARNLGILFLI